MKLELKHLAPYLPYGLKAYCEFSNDGWNKIPLISEIHTGSIMDYVSNKTAYRPLLIPLSELIDSNSGTAPLTEIAFEFFGFGKGYISEPEFKPINENGFIGFQSVNQGIYLVKQETNYGISTYFLSALKDMEGLWIPQKVTSQLEMFEYLFNNHYDVFGLIDAGLALNKLDYQP